jgi:hypothetical protein
VRERCHRVRRACSLAGTSPIIHTLSSG